MIDINERFGIGESVRHMQGVMREVTKKEVTADTCNAAAQLCGQINNSIKTAIMAAKFLSDK